MSPDLLLPLKHPRKEVFLSGKLVCHISVLATGSFLAIHVLGAKQTENAWWKEGSSETPVGGGGRGLGFSSGFLSRRISSSFPAVSPMGCVT